MNKERCKIIGAAGIVALKMSIGLECQITRIALRKIFLIKACWPHRFKVVKRGPIRCNFPTLFNHLAMYVSLKIFHMLVVNKPIFTTIFLLSFDRIRYASIKTDHLRRYVRIRYSFCNHCQFFFIRILDSSCLYRN